MNRTPTILGFMNRKFTYQETLDYIEQKLHEQGRASYSISSEMCLYRDGNGIKCGVGHIIPDKLYDQNIEFCPVDEALSMLTPVQYEHNNPRLGFLIEVQKAHDDIDPDVRGAAFRSSLHSKFSVLRREFNLTPFKVAR